MHAKPSSLMGRALLALLLTIGFYALALGIAALLLLIVYAQFSLAHRVNLRLTLICLVTAGVILWSILPRPDRFEAPGPRLEPEKHPRLFAEVDDIARQVKQKMPAEVYLIPAVNAFVAERGGFMGMGSKRVMGVGLPLLQILSVPQFRGVVAHEFGHFYGGDTKLGPWIYKTRMAIGRTIQGLGRSWLQAPFRWYGMLFLRVTHAVSRRQEFVADQLAAQTVGMRPFVEGLRAIHGADPAFNAYIQNEFVPVIEAGYHPPLAEGFAHFVGTPTIAEAMEHQIAEEISSAQTDPYDTHPSLKERVAAVQSLPVGPGADGDASALSLLQDVPDLERLLLEYAFGPRQTTGWKPIEWRNVGSAVWVPFWEKTLGNYAASLKGVTAASLPEFIGSPGALARQLEQSAGRTLGSQEVVRAASGIAAMALTVALTRRGWMLDAMPGEAVSLRQGEHVVKPFIALAELASGTLSAEAWQQQCQHAGIVHLDLGDVAVS